VGHTEGITNVSAKGDGRYIISNGKDQALRLWDLRKMCSSEDFDNGADRDFRLRGFDYRCVDSGLGLSEMKLNFLVKLWSLSETKTCCTPT
jgi:WD40 repeat protein